LGKKEPSHTVGRNVNYYNHYGNQYGGSQKTKNRTAIYPAILHPGIYTKECKSRYNKGTCTLTFTAALVTKAKLW
jgi:hypothetical protein